MDLHPSQSTAPAPEGWPAGVVPISLEGLNNLGVDADGSIYWEGKPIEVRRALTLSWWQRAGATIVVCATLVSALAAVVSAYAAVAALPQAQTGQH